MSLLRPSGSLRAIVTCQSPRFLASSRPLQASRLYAHQSYGDGEGDPKGERPQQQGSSKATSDREHPGPPPPSAGQGTGGGPTKAGEGGHNDSQGKGSASSGSTSQDKPTSQASNGAQPKIHDEPQPTELSEEAKQHNKEMEQRYDRAHEKDESDQKVQKGYWSGESTS